MRAEYSELEAVEWDFQQCKISGRRSEREAGQQRDLCLEKVVYSFTTERTDPRQHILGSGANARQQHSPPTLSLCLFYFSVVVVCAVRRREGAIFLIEPTWHYLRNSNLFLSL